MKTKCPHCNTVQKAPDEAAGREALCKSCRKKFTITPLQDTQPNPTHMELSIPPAHSTLKPPAGIVTTICTFCGLAFVLPVNSVGWQTSCPGCDHHFRVYIPGGASQSSLLTCSDCLARISPRTFGHLTDDHKVLCYRCLCKANTDLINNHMLPAMPPERLLAQRYCDRCNKHMSFPPSALDRIVTCPHCFRPVHTAPTHTEWQMSIRVAIWIIAWILIVSVIGAIASLLLQWEP